MQNVESLKVMLAGETDPAMREAIKLEILREHWGKIHGARRIMPTFGEVTEFNPGWRERGERLSWC